MFLEDEEVRHERLAHEGASAVLEATPEQHAGALAMRSFRVVHDVSGRMDDEGGEVLDHGDVVRKSAI
jgi:hypothetical protein